MTQPTAKRRYGALIVVWTLAGVAGLTVALLAVGWLGLWVAVGAFAGLGTTIGGGLFGQFLFATDVDAMIAARRNAATDRDIPS